MTPLTASEDTDFPMEAVMELVQICRSDDMIEARANLPNARQALVEAHVNEVSARYGVDPKQLAHVTALMMDRKPVPPALLKRHKTYPMTSTSEKAHQLLQDLADDNPAPEQKIFARDWFDPMHGLTELRYAAKRGLIDLVETGRTPSTFRFLLTDAGRAAAAEWDNQPTDGLSLKLQRLRELIVELAFENPVPAEKWIAAGNFEPRHGKTEISYALDRKWIETKEEEPDGLHLRLTPEGRKRLQS